MHKWCHSCSFWAGLEGFWNVYRCGLKHSVLDTVPWLAYLPVPGKLLFHFPALPQISCVWPCASYYNICGFESPSCKPEIILPHPLWLCLYIRQAPWGTASRFLFVWQTVLNTTWSWTWFCHPDTAAWSVFLYPYLEGDKKSLRVSFTLQWEQDAGVLREAGGFWRWTLV